MYIFVNFNVYSSSVILSSAERKIFSLNTVKCYRRQRVNSIIAGLVGMFLATPAIKASGLWRNSATDISFIFIVNTAKCF